MNPAQAERAGLVEAMRAVGPDAPTLCEGWTTRDLAAHLVIRERRLDAAPGILIPALAGHTQKVQNKAAQRPWNDLLADIASGPPIYSPLKPIDRVANLAEYFVHHEDVLRGGADPDRPWTPRPLPADLEQALRGPLKMIGNGIIKKSPVPVTLQTSDGETVLSSAIAGGPDGVTVVGTIGELALFVYGRTPVDLDFRGSDDDIAALRAAPRGL